MIDSEDRSGLSLRAGSLARRIDESPPQASSSAPRRIESGRRVELARGIIDAVEGSNPKRPDGDRDEPTREQRKALRRPTAGGSSGSYTEAVSKRIFVLAPAGTAVGYSRVKHARHTEPSGMREAHCIPSSER